MFPFYTPWKHQKTVGFWVFPEGIEWERWSEMVLKPQADTDLRFWFMVLIQMTLIYGENNPIQQIFT